MKVWATTVREEKITRDIVFEYEHISNEDDFVAVLQQICEKLDIPTPVVTYVNFNHYVLFNTTKFKSRDFVESIDFDYFNLEAVPDKKKK
ncbi:MAG: hypothetical protein IJ322_03935 [Clostridia bacterium]|nr:hypothetical protein [Clostridia bacterium]